MITDDTVSRLSAGVDEDERIAWEAISPESLSGMEEIEEHQCRHRPARTLRELPLKRLILERHKPVMQRKRWSPEEGWTGPMVCPECSPDDTDPDIWNPEPWPCEYIKALQAIYEPTEESA